jgi:predicted RNA-binding protein with PIN domain
VRGLGHRGRNRRSNVPQTQFRTIGAGEPCPGNGRGKLRRVDLIVDGMNVIGARPDGWWRDRAGAQARLVAEVEPLAGDGTEVTVVFDGRPTDAVPSGSAVHLVFAPGGPNAADDAIVELVRSLDHPDEAVVVTSDRNLAERVRGLGAAVEGVTAFRSGLAGS